MPMPSLPRIRTRMAEQQPQVQPQVQAPALRPHAPNRHAEIEPAEPEQASPAWPAAAAAAPVAAPALPPILAPAAACHACVQQPDNLQPLPLLLPLAVNHVLRRSSSSECSSSRSSSSGCASPASSTGWFTAPSEHVPSTNGLLSARIHSHRGHAAAAAAACVDALLCTSVDGAAPDDAACGGSQQEQAVAAEEDEIDMSSYIPVLTCPRLPAQQLLFPWQQTQSEGDVFAAAAAEAKQQQQQQQPSKLSWQRRAMEHPSVAGGEVVDSPLFSTPSVHKSCTLPGRLSTGYVPSSARAALAAATAGASTPATAASAAARSAAASSSQVPSCSLFSERSSPASSMVRVHMAVPSSFAPSPAAAKTGSMAVGANCLLAIPSTLVLCEECESLGGCQECASCAASKAKAEPAEGTSLTQAAGLGLRTSFRGIASSSSSNGRHGRTFAQSLVDVRQRLCVLVKKHAKEGEAGPSCSASSGAGSGSLAAHVLALPLSAAQTSKACSLPPMPQPMRGRRSPGASWAMMRCERVVPVQEPQAGAVAATAASAAADLKEEQEDRSFHRRMENDAIRYWEWLHDRECEAMGLPIDFPVQADRFLEALRSP